MTKGKVRQSRPATVGQIDYRLFFESMSEGAALCEPVFDDDRQLIDYRFLHANPAFLAGFGFGADIVGRCLTELRPDATLRWFANFQATVETGQSRRFRYHDRLSDRWYDVHCTRVSEAQFAHFYIDISAMKRAEAHQASLLDELNHRVKNNLAIIASLLELQARAAPDAIADHLRAAVTRVHAVADLHADLYRRSEHEFVALDRYLRDLADRLVQSFGREQIQLTLQSSPVEVRIEQAIQLGLVANELVTNAFKHAFPDTERGGAVSIHLESVNDILKLTVADDGVGLPASNHRRRGLGTRMIESLVQQCGGTLMESGDGGARFEVQVPWTPADHQAEAPLL